MHLIFTFLSIFLLLLLTLALFLKIHGITYDHQMYRSMRESTVSNEFIAIKNYQEKKPNLR